MSANLIPAEIQKILDNYNEDYRVFRFTKADFAAEKPIINLEISAKDFDDANPVLQQWTVEIAGYRSGIIAFEESY